MSDPQYTDVIIVGAGISGICAGYYIQEKTRKSYVILEARENIGGTWDLFRYPGIRSDSDMYTFSFSFHPWQESKQIVPGAEIREYLKTVANKHKLQRNIRTSQKVVKASFCSSTGLWTLETSQSTFCSQFFVVATGYYDYDAGFTPEFKGRDEFKGEVLHAQKFGEDVNYSGKRVVVVGSGATAITLAPELAKQAEHVVLLQRSPTYIVPQPASYNPIWPLRKLMDWFPSVKWFVYRFWRRWFNAVLSLMFYHLCKAFPAAVRSLLKKWVQTLVPPDVQQKHFTPRYNPWDQRLCVCPDGDFYRAVKAKQVNMVTDRIASFTPAGLLLESGEELKCDMVVLATGLNISYFGKAEVEVDGKPLVLSEHIIFKGCMLDRVPNLFFMTGYINASWTLKIELTCDIMCRVIRHMHKQKVTHFLVHKDKDVKERLAIDMESSYFLRAKDSMCKQGERQPWDLSQNYLSEVLTLPWRALENHPAVQWVSAVTSAVTPAAKM